MLFRKSVTIAVFVAILFTHCVFTPDELQETFVEKPSEIGPPITFQLNDLTDTIKIGWPVIFNYKVNGTNKLITVEVKFGDQILHHLYDQEEQSLSFDFDPRNYPNGNYHLAIQVATTSGTGSIADKVGAEGYLYELNWPMVIDNTMPSIMHKILDIKKENGVLKLSWQEFNHPNFISYKIYSQVPQINMVPQVVATIIDPKQTSYTHNTFIEGQANLLYYSIKTPAGEYNSNYIWHHDKIDSLKAQWNTDGSILFEWKETACPTIFREYHVKFEYFNNTIEEYKIIDPKQHSVVFKNAGFANDIFLKIKFLPNYSSEDQNNSLSWTDLRYSPKPMYPVTQRCITLKNSDLVLMTSKKKLYKYNPIANIVLDSFSEAETFINTLSMCVNDEGNKLAYIDYKSVNFYAVHNKIKVRRTDNFSLISELQLPEFKERTRGIEKLTISENNLLVAIDNRSVAYTYNINSGSLISRDSLQGGLHYYDNAQISRDGKYLFAWNMYLDHHSIYKFQNNSWVNVKNVQKPGHRVLFDSNGKIYSFSYEGVEIRSSTTLEVDSGYSLPHSRFPIIDQSMRKFLWQNPDTNGEYFLCDLETGIVSDTLFIGNTGGECAFKNNLLVSPMGLQLIIEK